MILKLIDNGIERVFYSQDVIEKIRSVNNELLEQYPECARYAIAIHQILNDSVRDLGFWDSSGKYKEDLQIVDKREL